MFFFAAFMEIVYFCFCLNVWIVLINRNDSNNFQKQRFTYEQSFYSNKVYMFFKNIYSFIRLVTGNLLFFLNLIILNN